jgi:hypothetical protein
MEIYLGNGDSTFYGTTVLTPGLLPGNLVVGDFNGNGQIDLAIGSSSY